MSTFEKFNEDDQLFVYRVGNGYGCIGLENARAKVQAVASWVTGGSAAPIIGPDENGYTVYLEWMEEGRKHAELTGTRCPAELTSELIGLEGRRVEVIDAYGDTRRFQVGKSTGWMPCHLEIARRTSTGGPAVYGAPFRSVRVIR
jgi:hypothetical protein